jgi:hypothetical protein
MHKSVHQLLFKVSAALARDSRRQARVLKFAANKPDTTQKNFFSILQLRLST